MIDYEGNERYSIGELAALAGISRRTVRFYVQSKLISPPLGAGRGSYYTAGHLESIRRIRRRQAEGHGLSAGTAPGDSPSSGFHAEAVIRISLLDGYSLMVDRGCGIPSLEILRKLVRALEGRRSPDSRDERDD